MKKISMKHGMRCLILFVFAAALAGSCNDSNADTKTKTEPAAQATQQKDNENIGMDKGMDMNQSDNAGRDYVMMHDGKVMMMKGGKSTPMTSDMTMSNGTMVMKNSTVMMKDGISKSLQEGEVVYMDGSMGRVNMSEHKHE